MNFKFLEEIMLAIVRLLLLFGYLSCMENNQAYKEIIQLQNSLKTVNSILRQLREQVSVLETQKVAIEAKLHQWNQPKDETMFSLDEDLLDD